MTENPETVRRSEAGSIGAQLAASLLPEWIFEEIYNRCLVLGCLPCLAEADIVARLAADLGPELRHDELAVVSWIAGLFRDGAMTGAPVDDWRYLAEMANRRVGDDVFDPAWAGLAADFFRILHPDRRPGDLSVRDLRGIIEMLVAAVALDRALKA